MADFKTHLSFGAATGFTLAIGTYLLEWIDNVYMAVIVFFSTVIGAFLPDMDSNSGLPVKIIFGLYAYLMATLTIYWMHDNGAPVYLTIFSAAAAFVFVQFYLQKIFKKYTRHRGIFHSVPAALIAFFLTLIVADTTRLQVMEKFVMALAIGLGYFSHLLLDEIFSVTFLTDLPDKKNAKKQNAGFFKRRFRTKSSFGTALDLGFNAKHKYPAIIAYLVLIVLIGLAIPIMKRVFYFG